MNKNTTNQINEQEFKPTELKLTLRTGVSHKNKFMEAQSQIDYTSYYVGSIFWFIRVVIEAESLLEIQTESKAYNDAQFRENIQFLAQIGESFCEYLPNYSNLLSPIPTEEIKGDLEFDISEKENFGTVDELGVDGLAVALSGILDNPNLPDKLYDNLKESIIDLFNCDVDQTEFHKDETSPEYIAKVLRGYQAKQNQ